MEDHTYQLVPGKTGGRVPPSSKKRKRNEVKRNRDRRRQKSRVNFGVAFPRWKSLMRNKGLQSHAEDACFLLDSWFSAVLEKSFTRHYSAIEEKSIDLLKLGMYWPTFTILPGYEKTGGTH